MTSWHQIMTLHLAKFWLQKLSLHHLEYHLISQIYESRKKDEAGSLADWPPKYHKTAWTFPRIFCTPYSMIKPTLNEPQLSQTVLTLRKSARCLSTPIRTSSKSLRNPLNTGTRSRVVFSSPTITASSWIEKASVRRTFHYKHKHKNKTLFIDHSHNT